jgi:hypothetical protein
VRRQHPSEQQVHFAVADYLRLRGKSGLLWLHTPNEPRDKIAGARLKRMGMLAGTSDLLLWYRGKAYALELKTLGGRPSDVQLSFLAAFNNAGGRSAIAFGLDQALASLVGWGLLK